MKCSHKQQYVRLQKSLSMLILLFFALLCSPQSAGSKVYLEINQPHIRKIPLAIAPLKSLDGREQAGKLATTCREVMIQDLDFSTFFNVLGDSNTYLENSRKSGISLGTFDFGNWSLIGAELLIKGGYYQTGDQFILELRLFDVFSRKMIIGKRYRGRLQDQRLMAHKFDNEVVKAITGLPGEFSSKIAFVGKKHGRHGVSQEIYIMDYDGTGLKQVTHNRAINLSPSWDPKVTKLAFTSYKKGNPDLYIIDFNRGKERLISRKKGINAAAEWSNDASRIVLMQRFKDNSEISIISANTGRLIKRMTKNWANEASPCWSPSGKEIAFVSDRAGSPQIYTMNIKSNNLRRVTRSGNYNAHPNWSKFNNKIVFTSIIDGSFQICAINPDGSDLQQLSYLQGDNEDPSWSPNGQHIVFTSSSTGIRQLMVMNLHGRDIKPITRGKLDKKSPTWSENQ
ncbi:MAG: Tol-Pal system beta propeller repeat protein TolB [Xanthomonadaceae bacterium]|nr:Tol-Pal system beta propeller repeat protein TolB [Xanthomonadaceae bacterium]